MATTDAAMYVSIGEASRSLGLCPATLRKLAKSGRIDAYLTETGRFRINVAAELEKGRQRLAARAKAQAAAQPEASSA
jgi:predicted site-specific integrase-resolvase